MRTSVVRGALLLTIAVALTGCSASQATPTESSSTSATPGAAAGTADGAPSGGATGGATPASTKDVLFTVSAHVRDKRGSTVAIQLTAHAPILAGATAAKPALTQFLAECGAGPAGTPVTVGSLTSAGSVLMTIDVATSVIGKTFAYPIDLALGSQNFAQAAKGTGIIKGDSASPCYGIPSHRWVTSSNVRAVADFESGTATADVGAWRYGQYGFSVPFDSNSTIEACSVTLTALAKAANLSGIAGWDPNTAASGTACVIGHVGE